MPRWVTDAIEVTLGAPVGARNATAKRCKRGCGALVLAGLDADLCALSVEVEPTPVNAEGELRALIARRRTFTLSQISTKNGLRLRLDNRTSWRIAGMPPTRGVRYDVVVSHRCEEPLPDTHLADSNLT